jgi:hypothetical protein
LAERFKELAETFTRSLPHMSHQECWVGMPRVYSERTSILMLS